jgi:hypothetical protein
MKNQLALGSISIVTLSMLGACNKTPAERSEEAARERAEQREEVREERQELREDTPVRANANEHLGTNQPSANGVKKGLEAATVNQIAEARCAREAKCGNIGVDKEYASTDLCRQKIGIDWSDEISAYDCPAGVVQKELNECLEAIKGEECNSPFDTLGRVVACRSSDICKTTN